MQPAGTDVTLATSRRPVSNQPPAPRLHPEAEAPTATRRRLRVVCGLGVVVSLLVLTLLATPAYGQQCPDGNCPTTETPTPTPTEGSGPGQIIRQIITNITEYVLRFPVDQMFTAINQITGRYLYEAYEGLGSMLAGTVNDLLFGDYSIGWMRSREGQAFLAAPLFEIIEPFWSVSWSMSQILLTATLALTLVTAMRHGMTSIFTAQEFKEALFSWIQSAVLAWASLYILQLAYWLSTAGAAWLMDGPAAGQSIVAVFFQGGSMLGWLGIAALATAPAFTSFAIIVLFITLVVGFIFVLFMELSLAAFIAAMFMIAVLAPLAFTVSSVPDLGYLRAMFVRGAGMVLLMPIVDAALLMGILRLVGGAPTSLANFYFRVWMAAGLISALVMVNGWLIQQIFTGLQQAVSMVTGAVTGLVGAALVAASPLVDSVLPGAGQVMRSAGGSMVASSLGGGEGKGATAAVGGAVGGKDDGKAAGGPTEHEADDKDVSGKARAMTSDQVRDATAARRRSAGLRSLGGRLMAASGLPGGREAGLLADWSARRQEQDAHRSEHGADQADARAERAATRADSRAERAQTKAQRATERAESKHERSEHDQRQTQQRAEDQKRREALEAKQDQQREAATHQTRAAEAGRLATTLKRHFPESHGMATFLRTQLEEVDANGDLTPADRARARTGMQDIVNDERTSPDRFADRFAVWSETYLRGSEPAAQRAEVLARLSPETGASAAGAPENTPADQAGSVGASPTRGAGWQPANGPSGAMDRAPESDPPPDRSTRASQRGQGRRKAEKASRESRRRAVDDEPDSGSA